LFIACQVLPRAGQQYLSTKTAPVHSADANNSSTLLVKEKATIRSQNFKAIWNVIILVNYATGLDY